MSSGDYKRSAEWRQAEVALAVCVGYKIAYTPEVTLKGVGLVPAKYERQRLSWEPKDGKTVPYVVAISMSDKSTWDLWCEAVKLRIDHAGACKLAWDLYAAGTGVTLKSFNGMPSGEPAAHVREERKRLLDAARPRKPINIVIDGHPGAVAGRFVEVEDDERRSLNAGEWSEYGQATDWWKLRITELPPA